MSTNAILEHRVSGRDGEPLRAGAASFRRLLGSRPRNLIENIRANLGRVGIPLGLPVTVNLPVRTEATVLVSVAPIPQGRVRHAQTTVRTKMRHRGDPATRRGGAHHVLLLSERPQQLDPDFQPNTPIPIDGDVAPAPRILSPHRVPNQAAALRYYPRQLRRARRASNDSERPTGELLQVHGVRHEWSRLPNGARLSCGALVNK